MLKDETRTSSYSALYPLPIIVPFWYEGRMMSVGIFVLGKCLKVSQFLNSGKVSVVYARCEGAFYRYS